MAELKTDYYKARQTFYDLNESLSQSYNTMLTSHTITDDLTMDIIEILPKNNKNLLWISTGLHGIEGFIGNFVLQEFVDHIVSEIDLNNTHVVLIHGINPYGMLHKRKVNENNIDLNRNFVNSFSDLPINNGYENLKSLLLPKKLGSNLFLEKMKFYMSAVSALFTYSASSIREACLVGQYSYGTGFYYGGEQAAKSTRILMSLLDTYMETPYEKRIFLDVHTGYGPKNQMMIINSPQEKRNVEDMKTSFEYPYIQTADGDDFYRVNGDLADYINTHAATQDYATCFEFGTIGDSMIDELKSLRIMVQENCVHHKNSPHSPLFKKVKREFEELYMPKDKEWLAKVLVDFSAATRGILKHYNILI